jgi:hypothetical protein
LKFSKNRNSKSSKNAFWLEKNMEGTKMKLKEFKELTACEIVSIFGVSVLLKLFN